MDGWIRLPGERREQWTYGACPTQDLVSAARLGADVCSQSATESSFPSWTWRRPDTQWAHGGNALPTSIFFTCMAACGLPKQRPPIWQLVAALRQCVCFRSECVLVRGHTVFRTKHLKKYLPKASGMLLIVIVNITHALSEASPAEPGARVELMATIATARLELAPLLNCSPSFGLFFWREAMRLAVRRRPRRNNKFG
jgi:hypothetical protein